MPKAGGAHLSTIKKCNTLVCAIIYDNDKNTPNRQLNSRVFFTTQAFTLCFVMAPTISGQTIPDKVPTPLEMPMRMLAYRGAMSRWLTLKPYGVNKELYSHNLYKLYFNVRLKSVGVDALSNSYC